MPVPVGRQVEPLLAGVDELGESLAQLAGSVAIEALIACGDLQTAERLLALLDERAAGADTPLLPLAHRCHGLLLAERGDTEAAIAALEAAAVEPEPPREGNPFELARTLLALGTVQRRAQHKRAARESLQRAAEIFDRLGARLWLAKARSELRRIGGRTASEGQLSETERRIVELVVAGRRNREVAAELSLSPNTVAWNLSKVYRKLGVSSRTELAAHISCSPTRVNPQVHAVVRRGAARHRGARCRRTSWSAICRDATAPGSRRRSHDSRKPDAGLRISARPTFRQTTRASAGSRPRAQSRSETSTRSPACRSHGS